MKNNTKEEQRVETKRTGKAEENTRKIYKIELHLSRFLSLSKNQYAGFSLPLGSKLRQQLRPPQHPRVITIISPSTPEVQRWPQPKVASAVTGTVAVAPPPSIIISGHHRPPLPTPTRPKEPPQHPLHKGTNHFSIPRSRKIHILLCIFSICVPVTVCA